MVAAANLVEVAALVGDTARATMLNALMRVLREAAVTPNTKRTQRLRGVSD
jgi:hypothetical protein